MEFVTIHIPEISYKNSSDNFQRYYRNLIYLLKTFISEEEAVFMLNYLYMTPLVKLLHEHFLNCKVVAVVHYLIGVSPEWKREQVSINYWKASIEIKRKKCFMKNIGMTGNYFKE